MSVDGEPDARRMPRRPHDVVVGRLPARRWQIPQLARESQGQASDRIERVARADRRGAKACRVPPSTVRSSSRASNIVLESLPISLHT
jgi:hypothetical protein